MSRIVVTLYLIIGLYAGKLLIFLGPLKFLLFGKIQILNFLKKIKFLFDFKFLLEFFYIILMKEKEQSAGNFENYEKYSNLIPSNLFISDHMKKHVRPITNLEFGYYLAGLIEGQGNFLNNSIEINFREKDTYLAYFIKKQIGYGSVKKGKPNNNKFVKYILTHKEGLKKVINLVNGKFLTNNNINQLLFFKFDKKFNITILPSVKFNIFSNYWLSGFTDATGSFFINLDSTINLNNKSNLNLSLEFFIKYKNISLLKFLHSFLGGNLSFLESEDLFFYNSCEKNNFYDFKSAKILVNYFDKFNLNSSIIVKYLRWRKVYRIIQRKEHLNNIGLDKIIKIRNNLRD